MSHEYEKDYFNTDVSHRDQCFLDLQKYSEASGRMSPEELIKVGYDAGFAHAIREFVGGMVFHPLTNVCFLHREFLLDNPVGYAAMTYHRHIRQSTDKPGEKP